MRHLTAAAVLALLPFGAVAAPPPADALALSDIIAKIETDLGDTLAYIDEVNWDDDGYWEVEYRTTDNAEVDIRVDPITGETLPRR
ncbi:MAG: PepSY domain-containing protein [Paracoccus sp. (in: a-proteobacteria)]|nr:PepSY domain-containing protein [Paracoccus sp. (in: a-proteobacteria)]